MICPEGFDSLWMRGDSSTPLGWMVLAVRTSLLLMRLTQFGARELDHIIRVGRETVALPRGCNKRNRGVVLRAEDENLLGVAKFVPASSHRLTLAQTLPRGGLLMQAALTLMQPALL